MLYTLVRNEIATLPEGFSVKQENISMFSSIHALLLDINERKRFL